MIILKTIDGNVVVATGDRLVYTDGTITLGNQLMSGLNIDNLKFTIDDIDYSFEDGVQVCKPINLKTAENNLLSFFDTLRGDISHANMGFDELTQRMMELKQIDPIAYNDARDQLSLYQATLQRLGGTKYWDDMKWHSEI
jgi:hypothetical protein